MSSYSNSPKRRKIAVAASAFLAVALSLSGCSGGGTNADSTDGAGGTGTLAKITSSGKMVVGVKFDSPPYGSIPEGTTEPVGFDIDIAAEIGKRLGVKTSFVQVTAKSRVLALQTGKIDLIAASMFHTKARDKAIDFSINYFEDQNRLMVLGDSDITGTDDLAGRTAALTQGSTQEVDIKIAQPEVKTLVYQTWPDTLQALLRGEADAVVSSNGLLSGLLETANAAGENVKIVGEGFGEGPVGLGMRQDDSKFRDAVNFALMDMQADGTYEEIFQKWWGKSVPNTYQMLTWPDGS